MLSNVADTPNAGPLHIDFAPTWQPETDVTVLAGSGASATVNRLLQLGHRRVFVYLPPESPERPDPRVRIVRSTSELWAALLSLDPPPQEVLLHRVPGGGVTSEVLQDLAKTIRERTLNRATFARVGRAWVNHCLRNMRHLVERPSVATLSGAFSKKPCVIVAAGPSLSKNIAGVRELAGHALILAGNRALAPLKHAGVDPDMVVVADALDLRYQLQGGLLDGVGALVLDLVCHPGVFELEARRHFTYTSSEELFATTFGAMGQEGLIRAGGSVATTCLQLALELGCDPILFVGQDLAISSERYYVETAFDADTRVAVESGLGTVEQRSQELLQAVKDLYGESSGKPVESFHEVPGWDGTPVYTSPVFDNYRRWLEGRVAELQNSVRVINCTEGGAYIQNMEHMPLAEAAAQLDRAPLEASTVLEAAFTGFDRRKQKKSVEGLVLRLQKTLNAAMADLERCETLASRLSANPDAMKDLDKFERRLRASLELAPFVMAWASLEVEAAERAAANATSLEDTVRASRALYSVVRKSTHAARPLLSETLQYVRKIRV